MSAGGAGVVVYQQELELLEGLPWLVRCLFFALKSRMDFATFRIGDRPRISWQAITEWLYVEPGRGPGHHGAVSRWQVMRAARHLVRAGLIKVHSSEVHRILVFSFPVARRVSLVRKKPARDPHLNSQHPPHRENGAKPARVETAKPATHPLSSGTTYKEPTTTTEHTPVYEARGGNGARQGLRWPGALSDGEQRAIERMLERRAPANGGWTRSSIQEILDELERALRRRIVRNSVAYIRTLIESYVAGTFVPTSHQLGAEEELRELEERYPPGRP